MARETKEVSVFGVRYRITQMPAAEAFRLMMAGDSARPLDILAGVSVHSEGARDWVPLDSEATIDTYVRDNINVMQPRLVLNGVMGIVTEFNWGFIKGRKNVRVPSYLQSKTEPRQVEGEDPVMSTLVAAGKATLRELQEFYSLADAFRIFDIFFIDKLNSAEAQHAAIQEAKSKH